MKKYLKNGQEVEVIKEIEGGYLYQHCFYDDYSDEEYTDESITCFTEKLFNNPPMGKLHEKIVALQAEIDNLENERDEINKLKQNEKELLVKIEKHDFVQGLVDYLNGDFKYVLYIENMEIAEKNSVYISPFIKITNTKNGGYSLFTLRNENYDDYDDSAIMVFKTIEEAREYAKKRLINELKHNTEKANYKWGSNNIKKWFDGIHRTCNLKDDVDIKKIYAEKFEEAKKKEDEEKRIRLQKEIEEKQNALKTIS